MDHTLIPTLLSLCFCCYFVSTLYCAFLECFCSINEVLLHVNYAYTDMNHVRSGLKNKSVGPVAQWITNHGIPGSNPGRVILFLYNSITTTIQSATVYFHK